MGNANDTKLYTLENMEGRTGRENGEERESKVENLETFGSTNNGQRHTHRYTIL